MSFITTYIDSQTGEEKKRYINRGRWKGYGPTSISFSDKNVGISIFFLLIHTNRSFIHKVPLEPPNHMQAELDEAGKRICKILEEVLYYYRPVTEERLSVCIEIYGETLLDKTSSS